MKLVRGSVTPVDLTGQATGDYLKNESGVWVPRTTAEVLQDVLYQDEWQDVPFNAFNLSAVGGTGSSAITNNRHVTLTTGTTASSTSRRTTGHMQGWSLGRDARLMDFSKQVAIRVRFSNAFNYVSANAVRWLYWGTPEAQTVTDPTTKGIGIRVDSTAIKGIVYDGATLTVVDLSVATAGSAVTDVTIISNNGSVEWFVDGVSKGTSAAGPTGLTTIVQDAICLMLTNGADTTDNRLLVNSIKVYVEQ